MSNNSDFLPFSGANSNSRPASKSTRCALVFLVLLSVVAFTASIVAVTNARRCHDASSASTTNNYYAMPPTSNGQVVARIQEQSSVWTSKDFVFDFNQEHPGFLTTGFGTIQPAYVKNWPALHDLAISQSLFHLQPNGCNSPHHHPSAEEVLFVIRGTIVVFRVEPNGGTIYNSTLGPLMSVVFPRGHIHFQANVGNGDALYISSLNSADPGVVSGAQRLCQLPTRVIYSMFNLASAETAAAVCGGMKGNDGIPKNPIEYKPGQFVF